MQLDAGAVLRKESGRDEPKIMRFLIGNPLIMKEMAKHIVNAASYAPVTVLAYEQSDGVHLSYDTMASLLAPYTNAEALTIARNLDSKIETGADRTNQIDTTSSALRTRSSSILSDRTLSFDGRNEDWSKVIR